MGSWKEDQKMKTIVLFLVTGSALARPRDVQDRLHPEEVKHILGIEDDELAPRHVPLDPQGRHVGAGLGFNVGPVGVGYQGGLGNGQLGFSGGLGWQGRYAHFGYPANYNRFWTQQAPGPIFHTDQLQK